MHAGRAAAPRVVLAFVGAVLGTWSGARGARAQVEPTRAPPLAARAADPPPGGPTPGPVVVLRATKPLATLQVETRLDWQPRPIWRDVCTTPCGRPVDPGALYRVAGRSVVASDPFTLPRQSGEVTIDAQLGSKGRHIVGKVFTFAGFGAVAAGALLYLAGSHVSPDAGGDAAPPPRLILQFYGALLFVAGAAVGATGIPLWATSSTSVDVK
jgi:hypothetical protein